jgi:sirohydrochlorin ferrochelatase
MSAAILLIAHGSRRAAANEDLVKVAAAVQKRRPDACVEIAYLELAEPDIPTGARRCVERGATEVRILPYFLSEGNHVRGDLEGFARRFEQEYPGVRFICCPPLGLHPAIVDVLLERVQEEVA